MNLLTAKHPSIMSIVEVTFWQELDFTLKNTSCEMCIKLDTIFSQHSSDETVLNYTQSFYIPPDILSNFEHFPRVDWLEFQSA